VLNAQGKIADTVRSVEPLTIEVEYEVKADITGLRVGVYLMSTRGEYIFTSFDTDEPEAFETRLYAQDGHLCQPVHDSGRCIE
jgi:lipopolysaccharide transport system ATP-binding protein